VIQQSSDARLLFFRETVSNLTIAQANRNHRQHFYRQDRRESIKDGSGSRPANYQKRKARVEGVEGLTVTIIFTRHGNPMLEGDCLGLRVPKVTGVVTDGRAVQEDDHRG
jgi:hypothetical protein